MIVEAIPESFVPKEMLLIRDSRVGDVLLTTPAIRRIKERFPSATLDVLTSTYARRSEVLRGNPHVRRVLACPKNGWLKWMRCRLLPRYDLVFPLRNRKVFLGIKATYTVIPTREPSRPHVVDAGVDRLGLPPGGPVPPPEIFPSEREKAQAAREVPPGTVGIYPSCHGADISRVDAGNPRRVWRAHELRAAVTAVGDAGFGVLLLAGSRREGALLEKLNLAAPMLVGGSITLLAARLARLQALLTVDTGPMHVAAAVGVPIVALFGPTRPEVTGPYSPSGRCVVLQDVERECVPCRGGSIECHDNVCMAYHTPERILAALAALDVRPPSG